MSVKTAYDSADNCRVIRNTQLLILINHGALAKGKLEKENFERYDLLKDMIKFSATGVRVKFNNIKRYYVYPAAEWVQGGTYLRADGFGFLMDSNHWTLRYADNLSVTGLYTNGLSIDVPPSSIGFTGRSFIFKDLHHIPEIQLRYKMTGLMILTSRSEPIDKSIIFTYAQSFENPGFSISVGPISFTLSDYIRMTQKQMRINFK